MSGSNPDDYELTDLILSLIITIILLFFGFKILQNFWKIFYNYYQDIYKDHNKLTKDDDHEYIRDEIEYKNISNEILKSINEMKLKNQKDFSKLKEYKKKYNLDNINYSEIDNKILSKEFDNYEYNNKPNLINFIIDIFKPTKK